MELEQTIRQLESEAVKYINAANALRSVAGLAERGRLALEAGGNEGPPGSAAASADADASETEPKRRGRKAKGDQAKPGRKARNADSSAQTSTRSYRWSPERRAAQSERMRQRRSQKNQEASGAGSTTDSQAESQPAETES